MLKCAWHFDGVNWPSKIEQFKAVFANASSPVNFIVSIHFFDVSVVPFDQINELTHERLEFKETFFDDCFLLVRCPIARDESKWSKREDEAIGWRNYDQWNEIDIESYGDDDIGDGLLDAIPGPSDQLTEVNK